MLERKVPGLYEIVPGLYQSAAPGSRLGPTHFELVRAGITCIVNTYKADRDPAYAGLTVINWPFADGPEIPEHLGALAGFVATLVQQGHNVLVHCQAGVNRSGLVNALVLRALLGCSSAEAIAIVRRGRGAHDYIPNGHFESYLLGLDTP